MFHRTLLISLVLAGLVACGAGDKEPATAPDAADSAQTVIAEKTVQIDTNRLSEIVKVLASDEFEGRAPGTRGEQKTVQYLKDQFAQIGLKPGGRGASWIQTVPLIHTQIRAPATISFNVGDVLLPLRQQADIEVSTTRAVESIVIEAPVVFVGFGASAPERDWDDYGEIDLQDKVALFLVNDPDFAAAPGEAVAGRFGGRRMTYYGR
jgi:hypothetical protein